MSRKCKKVWPRKLSSPLFIPVSMVLSVRLHISLSVCLSLPLCLCQSVSVCLSSPPSPSNSSSVSDLMFTCRGLVVPSTQPLFLSLFFSFSSRPRAMFCSSQQTKCCFKSLFVKCPKEYNFLIVYRSIISIISAFFSRKSLLFSPMCYFICT